jgi:hypothetical protein
MSMESVVKVKILSLAILSPDSGGLGVEEAHASFVFSLCAVGFAEMRLGWLTR